MCARGMGNGRKWLKKKKRIPSVGRNYYFGNHWLIFHPRRSELFGKRRSRTTAVVQQIGKKKYMTGAGGKTCALAVRGLFVFFSLAMCDHGITNQRKENKPKKIPRDVLFI